MKYSLKQRLRDHQIFIFIWIAKRLAEAANYFNDLAEARIESEMKAMSAEIIDIMKKYDEDEAKTSLH